MTKVKSGDLIIWNREDTWYAWVIRLFTLSQYTHVGIAMWIDDELHVVEANPPEVMVSSLKDRTPFMYIPMDMDFDESHRDYLLSKVGMKYSKIQAVLSRVNIYIDDDKWYCTETAYEYYKKFKPKLKLKHRLLPGKFVNNVLYATTNPLTVVDKL